MLRQQLMLQELVTRNRSRLKGHDGQQTWTGWAILAYNLDTYHHYAV